MCAWPLGGAPNYYPNSFSAPQTQPQFLESRFKLSADVARYNSSDDDNVTQVKIPSHLYGHVLILYIYISVHVVCGLINYITALSILTFNII